MEGKELDSVTLDEAIFGRKVNLDLIHQAVVTQLANARFSISNSKSTAEVAGSGKKPWRQKGTGRARTGSIRNSVWIGGGISFGPKSNQNFSKKFPKKMKRSALLQALSSKLVDKNILIIDELSFNKVKTQKAEKFLENLPDISGTILLVIAKSDAKIELSFRNLPYVKTILARNLNIVDVLKYNWLIITQESLTELVQPNSDKKNTNLKNVAPVEKAPIPEKKKTITKKPDVAKVAKKVKQKTVKAK